MAINFIGASNGGLYLYEDGSSDPFWANTVDGVADILLDKGIHHHVFGSSSMDFASEDGFDTDDGAMHLYKRALERAGI